MYVRYGKVRFARTVGGGGGGYGDGATGTRWFN